MPLAKVETLSNQGTWSLWHIVESVDQLWPLLDTTSDCETEFSVISHPQKKLEWLASRLLVQNLAKSHDLPYLGIFKDEHGKPHLRQSNWHISIAHCFPFAVAAINEKGSIGIDIEKPREQLQKVSKRFLSESEYQHAGENLELLCQYWTGKEVLYKIYGRKKLNFKKNILLKPHLHQASQYEGMISTNDEVHLYDIHYQVYSGHMVAHSREM